MASPRASSTRRQKSLDEYNFGKTLGRRYARKIQKFKVTLWRDTPRDLSVSTRRVREMQVSSKRCFILEVIQIQKEKAMGSEI